MDMNNTSNTNNIPDNSWIPERLRGKWFLMMMNRYGEWVFIESHKTADKARKSFKNQPRGYAYRLYDDEGYQVDNKGDASYIVGG